jgi:uncharacterized membrane protein
MVLLPLHVVGGVVGIVSGFVALYARKGRTLHRRSGMAFVYAMLSMSLSGTLLAVGRFETANVLAGLITAYLVVTAVTAVSTPSAIVRRLDRGAMLGALAFGFASVASAIVMFGGGRRERGLAVPLMVFGALALLSAAGDLRMIRAGGLRGAARLKRHLWRMCAALFVAAGSFFLGPVRRIPEPLRHPAFRVLPFVVLVTMVFWLWRYRRTRSARGFGAVTVPEAI